MQNFLETLKQTPEQISFEQTMSIIEQHYDFTPTAFSNGDVRNAAGENNGSCKLFAFAKLQGLDELPTLQCFGDYYRIDVLAEPDGEDHQNIRNFIQYGWDGVKFEGEALSTK